MIIARVLYLIHKITNGFSKVSAVTRLTPAKTLVCIGSGGHTTEMLSIIKNLDFKRYSPRFYVIAKSDEISLRKVKHIEQVKNSEAYYIKTIPRSRNVGQSYFSSIVTTLYSVVYCIPLVIKIRPDLILCNGPGTCIPICITAFLLKLGFISDTRIVFIESFCRTRSLSLTAKILMYIADNFIVPWPTLKQKLKRSEYIGQLL